ncbi:RNA polymerase sporulation sigma factor SigK [Caldanaerobius polysaccharolyticus]|uniref:RNA polymerase sporulation sigma factor SigK n=1 Tax=Caldanaerobius polysaccharolyticus TaxID=44256 RepID=UPI00068D906F|nr:RNA polymerase sporulation sigma factor SigK [Caldanaerobius polysaccharolyticus]
MISIGFMAFVFFLSGYVTTTSSFPQPLSAEEEERYIRKYLGGDEEAKNILIERNLRLVAHIVKKYSNTGIDSDDLISIGTIGLIKAITTFNDSKGVRLATYASRCIENELLMYLRSNKKEKNEISLQDPIGVDKEGNEISLIDIIPVADPDSVCNEVETKLQIKKLKDKINTALKNRERLVIELRYGLTNMGVKTQMEIARLLGISRSYVSRIEKKALKKLLKELMPGSSR